MKITTKPFGTLASGDEISAYTLRNDFGTSATILNYGATIQSIIFNGCDLVLGYNSLDGYVQGEAYIGATIGRVANRIALGKYSVDGVEYSCAVNNGPNCNHGGLQGFDRRVFSASVDDAGLHLTYLSKDGEEGFPGNVELTVTYFLTDDNELKINYRASTDRATPIQLTNHTYFNLSGEPTILNHRLQINSNYYMKCDENVLGCGEFTSLDSTPFDFRVAKEIGRDIRVRDEQLKFAKGYDHCFLIDSDPAATLVAAGIKLEVSTSMPTIHVYSGNYLDDFGKGRYIENSGVALEAGFPPDSVHHPELFDVILRPTQTRNEDITYRFGCK